jgi:hypothetical protein
MATASCCLGGTGAGTARLPGRGGGESRLSARQQDGEGGFGVAGNGIRFGAGRHRQRFWGVGSVSQDLPRYSRSTEDFRADKGKGRMNHPAQILSVMGGFLALHRVPERFNRRKEAAGFRIVVL